MTPTLVFDIETIPDVAGLRRLHADDPVWTGDDAAIAELAFAARRAKGGSDFLQHHLHRICAISCVFRDENGLRVRSLGSPEDTEAKLISQFFGIIDRFQPQLVSWNGGGFDLPVLNYRALINGVPASRYWDWGDDDRDYKYNNYLSRYHTRHVDLMDVLAMFTGRANAPLDDMAKLCGFPGKLGMDGSQVWKTFCDGGIDQIRAYCETDVMNTWLVWCRFQLMRGSMSPEAYEGEVELARSTLLPLAESGAVHWREYLSAWS
ncbi:3'-5' exonuclease [soil metagenome]